MVDRLLARNGKQRLASAFRREPFRANLRIADQLDGTAEALPFGGLGVTRPGGSCPDGASSSSDPDGHIDDLAAKVGNVLAAVFGTELVWRTVEILRQLHADVVRAWLRAPVA
jgi:hypothetical protein